MGDPSERPGFDTTVRWDFLPEVTDVGGAAGCPRSADASVTHAWAGLYEMTPDHNPIIGGLGVDGLYAIAGFSGHGFQHAPAAGRLLADLMLGRDPGFDLVAVCVRPLRAGASPRRAPRRLSGATSARARRPLARSRRSADPVGLGPVPDLRRREHRGHDPAGRRVAGPALSAAPTRRCSWWSGCGARRGARRGAGAGGIAAGRAVDGGRARRAGPAGAGSWRAMLFVTNFAWIAVNNVIAASVCARLLPRPSQRARLGRRAGTARDRRRGAAGRARCGGRTAWRCR